jgi:hypothetical protein
VSVCERVCVCVCVCGVPRIEQSILDVAQPQDTSLVKSRGFQSQPAWFRTNFDTSTCVTLNELYKFSPLVSLSVKWGQCQYLPCGIVKIKQCNTCLALRTETDHSVSD